MSQRNKSNFENFLENISPRVSLKRYPESLSSSSSPITKSEEELSLSKIWSSFKSSSAYGVDVPLTLTNTSIPEVTQYYVPTLSAIQIFTNKPLVINGSSPSSRNFRSDSHLYFEYNETRSFEKRPPLFPMVCDLAKENHGLYDLTISDLSEKSWFSAAWSPIYPIPQVKNSKALSVSFLTYHSLTTPFFPKTFPHDGKVRLPAFGVVTSKLFGDVWSMPETSDQQNIDMHEESAASWLGDLKFSHSDFDSFMAEKSN